MTLDAVVDALVVLLLLLAGAIIRTLWRLVERVSRLEGESRLERFDPDR